MFVTKRRDQRGITHLILIVIVIMVGAGVVGAAGYAVVSKNKDKDSNASTAAVPENKDAQQAVKAQCDRLKDEDLCKFYNKYKEYRQYRMKAVQQQGNP